MCTATVVLLMRVIFITICIHSFIHSFIHVFIPQMTMRLRHPNIVLFMGFCASGRDFMIITELCLQGSVHDVIASSQERRWGAAHHNAAEHFSWALRLAIDITRGMSYLHHAWRDPVVHQDLKSPNVGHSVLKIVTRRKFGDILLICTVQRCFFRLTIGISIFSNAAVLISILLLLLRCVGV